MDFLEKLKTQKELTTEETNQVIKNCVENKFTVFINHNFDTGEELYSVQLSENEFQLSSFKTKEEAVKFCKDNNLKIDPFGEMMEMLNCFYSHKRLYDSLKRVAHLNSDTMKMIYK